MTKFTGLLAIFLGLLLLCSSVLIGEDYSKLLSDFKNQSIPVEDISVKDDTVMVKLHYHQTEDETEDNTRKDIQEIIRKTAENFKDTQFISIHVFDTEQHIIDVTVKSEDALEFSKGNLSEEKLAEKMEMKEHLSLEEVLKSVIPNEEEINQFNAEYLKYTKELALKTGIEPLKKQIIDDSRVQDPNRPDLRTRTGGGGGASGSVIAAKRKTSSLLLLVGFLTLGCLTLIVGIRALKHRQSESVLNVRASLEVQYEDGSYKIYPIQKAKTLIGRDGRNNIVLNDSNASAFHAEILVSSNAFIIKDLESSNGTMVNGERVSQKSLYLEDEIVIGSTKLLVKS
ncbi:FHA domain-containing protein [Acidobacteriota bacterium]